MSRDYNSFLKSKGVNVDFHKRYLSSLSEAHTEFNVFDKLLNERIIFLWGAIDDYQSELIKANLIYLDSMSSEDIKIYINSPGGVIYSGLGILDVMDFVTSDVITVNTGLAASMAAVVLACGKEGKRKALKRSRTMIHQPLHSGSWMQQASDLEIEAKEINSLKKELYGIIADKTGQKYDKVYKDGDRDYWMTAMDAKKYGIIDDIVL
jgi:ATP-dependent Clp protease protease subunit